MAAKHFWMFPNWLEEFEQEAGYKMTKKWYRSRMIWINILAIAGSVIAGVSTNNWLDGETQVMILAAIDLTLRLRTNQGLKK